MLVTIIAQPTGTSEMRFPGTSRALGLLGGIDVQDDIGNFLPVGSLSFRIQNPQIGDQVLFVVFGQDASTGRGVGDGRVKRRSTHTTYPSGAKNLGLLPVTVASKYDTFACM
jgi:hypothetical protein